MSITRRTSFVELCSPVPLTHDLSVTASKAKLARQTPRPATQRQAQAELTRRKLLEAAVEHFSARHFDDVAASDITETAGVAQGLLFHYFGNKRGIYLEALRDAATRLNAATTPPPGDGAPFDLAFLDPPYGAGLAERSLDALAAGGWLAADAIAVVERGVADPVVVPAAFEPLDERVWGAARVSFLRHSPLAA